MRIFRILGVLVAMVGGGLPGAQRLGATGYPAAGADVFDPVADGEAQLKAGLAEAKAGGRRVVLMLGANWCPWCHRLDALLRQDPELQPRWTRDYVLVRIDVNWKGPARRNAEILARYRRAPQRGIPVLTLLAADGEVLARPDISRWETKEPEGYDVTKLRAFFAEWAPARAATEGTAAGKP